MNKSISNKLFKITFGLILALFIVNITVQLLFFEDFYLEKKVKDLKNEVNTFRTMYSYQIYNKNTLFNALSSYEESNNSKMAIFSLDGELKYLTNYENGTHHTLKELGRDHLPIEVLKVLANHESIDTTQSYLPNKDDELLAEAFNL